MIAYSTLLGRSLDLLFNDSQKEDATSPARMSSSTHLMLIPHNELEPATLRRVIEEFVTRDGSDLSPVDARIEAVLKQLENGRAQLHFDEDSKTCNIVSSDYKAWE